ncbi:alpha/beta-hydrolase [Hypoxylon trugodes]|uniref:alpha/beta-hydrolase n=1 Tax=Hypoxylon trugodes TaxID=326681 RepID=UPI002199204E|nr:alpha/beta-hydrolase [Hypoxylon trugodes]KAI1385783.1 alpha/beta-hydrolase [Hypoxylon trugodes]
MYFIKNTMGSFRTLLPFSLISLSLAQPYGTSKIQWGPCNKTEVPYEVPVECAAIDVPFDYTQSNSSETLQLDLVKVAAVVQPSKGSILLNFGGPGGTGRNELCTKKLSEELLALSGRQFDLIAFDPRGTSGSKIPIQCYENQFDAWNFLITYGPSNTSDTELAKQWAQAANVADVCSKSMAKYGSVVTSAFVARDMMRIVDALGEDGLLRYWGFSYGTTLGATTAAMFPDRVERMVLDGVQNPHEYYHAQADFEEWADSDKSFSAIFTGCVANRENCDLGKGNDKTAAELEQSVWDLLDDLKARPRAIGPYTLSYAYLKSFIVRMLYNSGNWPALATLLNQILNGQPEDLEKSLTAIFGAYTNITDALAGIQQPQALYSIHCSDNMVRTKNFDDWVPAVQRMYDTSRIIGDALVSLYAACAQWKIEPKERYTGDFNVKTKNPVLFIGNSHDALTPLRSAKNVSSTFEGSVVLEVDGYGHASLAAPSSCTIKTTSAYWVNGTLPPKDTICDSDGPLYGGVTWADVIAKVYGNGTAIAKRDVLHEPVIGGSLFPRVSFK